MSKITKEQLTKLKGQFAAKYGIEMDDWSAMVMTELTQRFLLFSNLVDKSIIQIDEAAKSIKGKVHQINFRNNQEALKFALGISAPFAAMGSLIAVLIFWYSTTTKEFELRKQIIEVYENAPIYSRLMQEGEIIERDGKYCLILTLANHRKDGILVGKEYVFDGKSKRILIPLGRK